MSANATPSGQSSATAQALTSSSSKRGSPESRCAARERPRVGPSSPQHFHSGREITSIGEHTCRTPRLHRTAARICSRAWFVAHDGKGESKQRRHDAEQPPKAEPEVEASLGAAAPVLVALVHLHTRAAEDVPRGVVRGV